MCAQWCHKGLPLYYLFNCAAIFKCIIRSKGIFYYLSLALVYDRSCKAAYSCSQQFGNLMP